jgi:ABC-type multidrug transport system fused ATPase/permease subunit
MLSLLVGTAVYASFPSPLKFPLLCAFGVVGKRLKKTTKKKTSERDDDDDAINSPIAMLRWSRVGLLSVRKKKKTKTTVVQILENVSGEAMPGRVLAIVGPSGAGKTSLLNALAQRVPKKGAELTGRIFVDVVGVVGVATKKKKKKEY